MNPVAFDPSACNPHIPKTDLSEQLKIYGEAPVTVSASIVTFGEKPVRFTTSSFASAFKLYENFLSLVIPVTLYVPL